MHSILYSKYFWRLRSSASDFAYTRCGKKYPLKFLVIFAVMAENFKAKFTRLLPIYTHAKFSKGIQLHLTKTKLLDFFFNHIVIFTFRATQCVQNEKAPCLLNRKTRCHSKNRINNLVVTVKKAIPRLSKLLWCLFVFVCV